MLIDSIMQFWESKVTMLNIILCQAYIDIIIEMIPLVLPHHLEHGQNIIFKHNILVHTCIVMVGIKVKGDNYNDRYISWKSLYIVRDIPTFCSHCKFFFVL